MDMNHTVAVTGGVRGTGKTTSVGSLGVAFADAGADALLVDCDFTDPSLAADLGITEPDATVRDVLAGRATVREAVHTGPAGVSVVPGARFGAPDAAAIDAFIDATDGFDVVICDTGHPFSNAAARVCDAADSVIVVSTPDGAARRNVAAVHHSLRARGRLLLGIVLTRVEGAVDSQDWDCELLATIPESDAVAGRAAAVLDSPSDPGTESYRELARSVYRRLRDGHDGTASNAALWLLQPADPSITGAVSSEARRGVRTSSNDETRAPDSAGDDDAPPERGVAIADGGTGPAGDAADPTAEADASTAEPDEDDAGGITLTRRSALAAITAAVGGVSAGILSTRETPTIEAFGYGGKPVSSTESGAASATNDTTSAGSLPTAGVDRTEPTTGSGDSGSEDDPPDNETEPGDLANTTVPENGNTTTTPANVSNITDPQAEVSSDQEPNNEPSADTSDSPPTSGGSTGNTGTGGGSGGGGGSSGGGGSDGGTEPDDESGDDTTDETSPSEPSDGPFGTVGYGEGGYGGVA